MLEVANSVPGPCPCGELAPPAVTSKSEGVLIPGVLKQRPRSELDHHTVRVGRGTGLTVQLIPGAPLKLFFLILSEFSLRTHFSTTSNYFELFNQGSPRYRTVFQFLRDPVEKRAILKQSISRNE
ncbi:hypothetical protein J6590_070930 [Homalodisca vitripennis]|nr:hypothetical protein J6590_070930 [Homalodisca vitripennis]